MSIMVKYLFFNLSTSEQFTNKYFIMLNSKANDSFKILVVIFKVKLSHYTNYQIEWPVTALKQNFQITSETFPSATLKRFFRFVPLKQKFPGLWHSHNQRSLFKFILMKQQQANGVEAKELPFVWGLRTRKFHARAN